MAPDASISLGKKLYLFLIFFNNLFHFRLSGPHSDFYAYQFLVRFFIYFRTFQVTCHEINGITGNFKEFSELHNRFRFPVENHASVDMKSTFLITRELS